MYCISTHAVKVVVIKMCMVLSYIASSIDIIDNIQRSRCNDISKSRTL